MLFYKRLNGSITYLQLQLHIFYFKTQWLCTNNSSKLFSLMLAQVLGAAPQFIHCLERTFLAAFPLAELSSDWLPDVNR